MKQYKIFTWLLLLMLLLSSGGCAAPAPVSAPAPASAAQPALPAGQLTAVFFDVGQADSLLISSGGQHMLVDAGNLGQDELMLGYLDAYGINKLDYLVATHPHADHIGAMAAVVYGMDEIGAVLMPQAIASTTVFEKLLDAVEQRGLEITVPQAGDTFSLGQATVQVVAPLSAEYEDLNNYSIVLRVSLGQVSFLLTGDAEALSETEQLQAGLKLSAQVLKAGHHGSSSSSTEAYLQAVAPQYAVISCGAGNSYGHPHAEVLSRLSEHDTQIYRTDESGTLEFVTDGQNITASAKGAALTQAAPAVSAAVSGDIPESGYIGNRNSHVFHLPGCASLPAEHNRLLFGSREEALAEGYRACKSCQPAF